MADAAAIAARLADYLGSPLANLRVLASGWETTVFEFTTAQRTRRLDGAAPHAPLVLRFYEGSQADAKGAREARTMLSLAATGFPLPHPYLFESDHAILGAPFLIMERVRGGPLFITSNFPRAFKTFSLGFLGFVKAQARLHRMDPKATVANEDPARRALLERILETIADRIEQGPLPGLRDAFTKLREQAVHFSVAPDAPDSIVHLDYHPQNAIVSGVKLTGVIDWVNADRGDRHLCAATSAVILASSAMAHPRWMRDNSAGNSLRALFTALYVPCYHALAPLDFARFRYYQAVASLARLSMFGIMRTQGPEVAGFRPEAIANVIPDVVRLLSRYAARKSGVPVSI